MSLPLTPSLNECPPPSSDYVHFSRVSLQPDGKKSTQLAYFNDETKIGQAIGTIFQDKSFDLPSPKFIIVLEGGLNNSHEGFPDFNEKQLSASVAKLILDIGRNKLSNNKTVPWLFTYVRHDSVASRIIQIAKQQYLANDIPLTRFVNIGIDVCQPFSLDHVPHDYQSIANAFRHTKTKPNLLNSHRVLNKRLSRMILYGNEKHDFISRCSVLKECVDEISHLRKKNKSECLNVPKIVLLYGGEVDQIQSIYRLIDNELEQRKFGLVIIRGSGGLADVLAWMYDKIHGDISSLCVPNSEICLAIVFLRELKVLVHQLLGCGIDKELLAIAKYLSLTRCRKVRVCDEDDDLSLYFLEALVNVDQSQRLPSLKLHLSLAFDLNQAKFASRMLRINHDLPEEEVILLAKMAIIRDQIDFLQVLEDLCGITSENLGENFDEELSSKLNYNHALFLECIEQTFGCSLDEVYRSMDESSEHTGEEIQSIHVKLFLWAVFFDHYNLSLHFWRGLNDRLCGALIAAQVYRLTADLCVKRSSTESLTVQNLRDHANEYENLAIRLLKSLHASNANAARLAIKRENFEFNKLSSLDVAIMAHSEDFIAHTTVQEVFDAIWFGEKGLKIKGKVFDRMPSTTLSSFGQVSARIPAKDQGDLFEYLLKINDQLSRPQMKYQVHFLSYLIFLCLLSYLVLFVKPSLIEINETSSDNSMTKVSKQSWSIVSTIVNIWVLMFAFEEFQQAKSFKTKETNIVQTFLIYLGESWNKLDCLCIFLYITSVLLECYNTSATLNAARALLAIDVVFWFVRLLTLLMIDRTVGPMLLMIRAMLNDMTTFFSIFFVFTLAYGVASFSLLNNGKLSFDLSVFRQIFHHAYWHVFGQMNNLENVKDDFELTGWVAFGLLALYMAISNVLLVNLLVAMFSNTFNRMYSRMDTLWKFYRYHVIKEYTILPTLPPPLNVFGRSMYDAKQFYPNLSHDHIGNLRRREALAYESHVLEQFIQDKPSEKNHREKLDSDLRHLKKLTSHVKITCEAWTGNA